MLDATVEASAAAGAADVSLEVLDGNDPALRAVRAAWLRRRRALIGYELEPPRLGLRHRIRGGLDSIAGQVAVRLLDSWGWPDPPWQLTPASLEQLPALSLSGEAVVIGRRRGSRFWLYALSVHPARRGRGLATRVLAALGADTIAIPALDSRGVGGRPTRSSHRWARSPITSPVGDDQGAACLTGGHGPGV